MIVIVGAMGVTAWSLRSPRGGPRRLVCLTDQFRIDVDDATLPSARAALVAMVQHSTDLVGQVRSVGAVDGLG